MAIFKYRK